jgi:hypothetical protein
MSILATALEIVVLSLRKEKFGNWQKPTLLVAAQESSPSGLFVQLIP